MKDLDFDELDKAVSSLMAGVPKAPDPSSETEKTVTIPSSDQVPSSPVTSPAPSITPTVSSPQAIKPAPTSAPSISRTSATPALRRTGRFMDVVRPSASTNKQEVPAKVSRQGIALEPVSTNVESTASVAELSTTPSVVGTDIQAKLGKTSQGDWPDPLDMAEFPKTPPATETEINDKKPDTVAPEVAEASSSDAPDVPLLTSPFLPDTRVEKRPLGANAVASAGVTEPPELSGEEAQNEDDQLPAKLEDTKSILPEELHSDLVAIESDTTSPHKEELDKQEVPQSWKSSEEPKPETSAAEPSKPSIPISIPQQYKEETSTGEKENGAIYDTDSYHKPLAHPTKQKSGWMWVVWIVLILIIGAGGGAALYFLRLV